MSYGLGAAAPYKHNATGYRLQETRSKAVPLRNLTINVHGHSQTAAPTLSLEAEEVLGQGAIV